GIKGDKITTRKRTESFSTPEVFKNFLLWPRTTRHAYRGCPKLISESDTGNNCSYLIKVPPTKRTKTTTKIESVDTLDTLYDNSLKSSDYGLPLIDCSMTSYLSDSGNLQITNDCPITSHQPKNHLD
ncbi:18832_t:CDS:1, partial [Gigaspora rosea]